MRFVVQPEINAGERATGYVLLARAGRKPVSYGGNRLGQRLIDVLTDREADELAEALVRAAEEARKLRGEVLP